MLTLSFPGQLPDMKTGTNAKSRLHWARKGKIVAEDRERWGWLLKVSDAPHQPWFRDNEPPFAFSWLIRWKDKRNRDADNVLSALKTFTDAMVDLRYLEDDNASIIRRVSIEQEFGSKEPGTTLVISGEGTLSKPPRSVSSLNRGGGERGVTRKSVPSNPER